MKKYSWIVALLIALTFATIFIACGVDPLDPPEAEGEEFEEVELSNFNAHGGNRKSQQGWGTDGLIFFDDGDGGNKMYAVKNIGVTVEQFQAAKFLQFDVNESKLSASGLDLIWAGVPDQGWNQANITTGAGGLSTGVTRDGGTIKIDLARAMANYTKFATYAPSEPGDGLRVIIQYGSLDHKDLAIENAKLLIPAEEPPFVSVTKIDAVSKALPLIVGATDLAGNAYPAVQSLTLVPVITTDTVGELPTVKTVIWSIVSDTAKTTAAGAKFVEIPDGSKTVTDKEQWPWVDSNETVTMSGNYADRITATGAGNIVVRAIVEDGVIVKESDVGKNLQVVAVAADSDSVFTGSDTAAGKGLGWVTEDDVGKTYDFISKEITIVASGFAKVSSFTAIDSFSDTRWSWFDDSYGGTAGVAGANDYAGDNSAGLNGLKGKIDDTASAAILDLDDTETNAEVWLYWKAIRGIANWGCGGFGGADITATLTTTLGATGISGETAPKYSTITGIARIPLSEVAVNNDDEIELNVWNNINITKIEIWADQ